MTEPFWEPNGGYKEWDGSMLDVIEVLVAYRFEHGRLFSLVERMVISGGERINRWQEILWKSFYDDCRLDRYIHGGRCLDQALY